jgi:hypothetical protein
MFFFRRIWNRSANSKKARCIWEKLGPHLNICGFSEFFYKMWPNILKAA